jgi:hypothetical protein
LAGAPIHLVRGWVFRISKGHTKHKNSANAIDPTAPFDEVRAASEYLYARHNLPAIFRLSPLAAPEIDKASDDAGYSIYDPHLVLYTSLSDTNGDSNVTIDKCSIWCLARRFYGDQWDWDAISVYS